MKSVAIIGGGLAGTACAYMLKQAGAEPVIYEYGSDLAGAASGNQVGLCNPRFTAEYDAVGEFYATAFQEAVKLFKVLPDVQWNPCGALHLITDEKKARRFPKTVKNWGWGKDQMRLVSSKEASKISGVEIAQEALYLPKAGTVCPKDLCHSYAQGVEARLNHPVSRLDAISADVVILSLGMGTKKFKEAKSLPLSPLRGQVTVVETAEPLSKLKCSLCYSGYVTPEQDKINIIGSSFQPWLNHDNIIDQDDQHNLNKLYQALPSLKFDYKIIGHRAGVRTASKDHFPIVGKLNEAQEIYISTAHGSHGILSSLLSAKIISAMIMGTPPPVSERVLSALSPQRFAENG